MLKILLVGICLCQMAQTYTLDKQELDSPSNLGISGFLQNILQSLMDYPIITNPQKVFDDVNNAGMDIPQQTYSIKSLCTHGLEKVLEQCPDVMVKRVSLCIPENMNKRLIVGCLNSTKNIPGINESGEIVVSSSTFTKIIDESDPLLVDERIKSFPNKPYPKQDATQTHQHYQVKPKRHHLAKHTKLPVRVLRVNRDIDLTNKPIQKFADKSSDEAEAMLDSINAEENNRATIFKDLGIFWMGCLILIIIKLTFLVVLLSYYLHATIKKRRNKLDQDSKQNFTTDEEEKRRISFDDPPSDYLQHPI